ncbi:phosphatase PAP2 family protein [Rummeliibacillus sp. TYF-LIM-RU47]|uniref:phosphatase PAP2 family protein n=1 Tax=Rummeliibacillus sp. TYF-LIM-RU47 TaxID=2608406 RepID=UPI00123A9450|nr:phosphatase PAP2 family protein [Rummeliibacillus sp. TYF-LIM-RU47]
MSKIMYSLGILAFAIFIFLWISLKNEWVTTIDLVAAHLLKGNGFIIAFHYIGEQTFILTIAVLLLVWLWLRDRNYRGMMFTLLTIGGGNMINQFIKEWVHRARPDIPNQLASFSFPSNHAMMSVLFLFTLAYFMTENKRKSASSIIVWLVAILLSLLIGLSRIAEGRHFASDVAAGWALGFTWFVIVWAWYVRRKKWQNT